MSYIKRVFLYGEKGEIMLKSILPPEMKGVMYISGYRGKGKTFLASQADFPNNIAFFDFEDKGEGVHNQINFGYYKAISQEENNPLARGSLLLNEIKNIPDDTFTTIVLDNISPFESSLMALVVDNPKHYAKLYGRNEISVIKDSYGARRGIVNELIADIILKPLYAKGIKLVIATSHIKQRYDSGGPIIGKMKMQGKDKWQELSILTLILVDGDNHPIPSAIVQKEQLASISTQDKYTDKQIEAITKGEKPAHVIIRRLPYRLPEATFQKIRWYLYNPANLNDPANGERVNEDEVAPFTEQLSKEQIAIHLLALENAKKQEEELEQLAQLAQNEQDQEMRKAVGMLNGLANKPPALVLRDLKEKIGTGEIEYDGEVNEISIKQVIEWSKQDG